ncbi:MAG: hypothetical protein IPO00_03200 [Betaproteobacteria bacterium]|nr:hypothetical protein [Betaproteobacteria bacterium]
MTFFSHRADRIAGTGLAPPVVRISSSVWAERSPSPHAQPGTIFTLRLPLADGSLKQYMKKKTLLIVDDDAVFNGLLPTTD